MDVRYEWRSGDGDEEQRNDSCCEGGCEAQVGHVWGGELCGCDDEREEGGEKDGGYFHAADEDCASGAGMVDEKAVWIY